MTSNVYGNSSRLVSNIFGFSAANSDANLNPNTYVTIDTTQTITGEKVLEENVTFSPSLSGSNEVRNTNTMPSINDNSTIVPTTSWVQSVFASSSYTSPFIANYTNWGSSPITPNCPPGLHTILTFSIPNQSRRYRIACVFASLVPGQQSVSSFTLQGIFYTNGLFQYCEQIKIGAGFNQSSTSADFNFTGGASSNGLIAGCSFMGGGQNTSQYTNQYSYEYVNTFPANAAILFTFSNSGTHSANVYYTVSLYYD